MLQTGTQNGVRHEWLARQMTPEAYDGFNGFFTQLCPAIVCHESMMCCRKHLHESDRWLFRRVR